jgi:NAD(P)H-dependent flavin oxidoreductase YrpB (nitropropane dioxygenase family)
MSTVENVVYRYQSDDQPAIHYHAIPSGCAGSAEDLGAARSAYRGDLTALLHVGRHQLPPVVEHIEAVVEGMWVRTKVGAVHRDHSGDRMFLQTLMAPGRVQDDLRAQLELAAGRGMDPVVVIVEPADPVGSVLAQMTPGDTVVLAYSDVEAGIGWAIIHGPEATGHQDIPRAAPNGAQLRDITVGEFAHRFGAAGGHYAVRVPADVLSLAS